MIRLAAALGHGQSTATRYVEKRMHYYSERRCGNLSLQLARLPPPFPSRIGVVAYSGRASIDLDFDDAPTASALAAAITALPHRNSATMTSRGLQAAGRLFTQEGRGRRPGVQAICILVTDGPSTEEMEVVAGAASDLKALGIRMMALGVLPGGANAHLDSLASTPVSHNVLFTNDGKDITAPATYLTFADAVRCP